MDNSDHTSEGNGRGRGAGRRGSGRTSSGRGGRTMNIFRDEDDEDVRPPRLRRENTARRARLNNVGPQVGRSNHSRSNSPRPELPFLASSSTQANANVSQEDADLAFARSLQEQEAALLMLQMQREQGAAPGGFGSSVSYQQELELQQMLMGMAGFQGAGYLGVDPDQMSYEELTALGEAIGTVKTGVPAAVLDSMPCSSYRKQNSEEGEPDPCTICCMPYEEDETILTLPCKHFYHSDCIKKWFDSKKVCPICNREVTE